MNNRVANTAPTAAPPPRLGIRIGKRVLRAVDQFFDRHSLIPVTPFLDASLFPELLSLQADWEAVRTELDQILRKRDEIPAFHQLSPDQVRISKGDAWKTFAFRVFSRRIDANCEQCPVTSRLLDALPGLQNAWFSILAPGYHIPPHRGPSKAVVRCHLGLRVPAEAARCRLRVDRETRHWTAGEWLCFDDTFEHEVHNDTDETRVVLFLDLDRPLDRVGNIGRQVLLWLIRRSAYVTRPLKNLEEWNRRLGIRAD